MDKNLHEVIKFLGLHEKKSVFMLVRDEEILFVGGNYEKFESKYGSLSDDDLYNRFINHKDDM